MMLRLLALCFLCQGVLSSPLPRGEVFSVLSTRNAEGNWNLEMVPGKVPFGSDGLVKFQKGMQTDGWDYLEIEMFEGKKSPQDMAWIAGQLEGMLTAPEIYDSWRNTMQGFCDWKGAKFCGKLRTYVTANLAWMDSMIQEHASTDAVWYQIDLVLKQLKGMSYAMGEYREKNNLPGPTEEELLWMNMGGDLEDLDSVFQETSFVPQGVRGDGHCSALIKLLPGNTDLFASHVTWNSLESMLRTQKRIILPVPTLPRINVTIPGKDQRFSSYPGILASGDDYYQLSSGLTTIETTIGNSNASLWADVSPVGEVQEWIRVVVANRLATSAEEWTKIFTRYNSGTYNNQWMVVDYNKFIPGKPLQPGTFWVAEQIPGTVVSKDMTQFLQEQTYWPSYNIPAFPEIFNLSGGPTLVEKYGGWFDYHLSPRAQIFKRDHGKVRDMGSMIKLMRYNDFTHDPLARCEKCIPPYSGENGISCRSDLNPANMTFPFGALGPRDHAGTDLKVTSKDMFSNGRFMAIAGPTHQEQPVFKWSTSAFNKSHHGHPDVFDFGVVEHQWIF